MNDNARMMFGLYRHENTMGLSSAEMPERSHFCSEYPSKAPCLDNGCDGSTQRL